MVSYGGPSAGRCAAVVAGMPPTPRPGAGRRHSPQGRESAVLRGYS
jgi:hypothetical protein